MPPGARTHSLAARFLEIVENALMTEAPTHIRAHQSAQALELVWADGRADQVPYRTIRGLCPCATCRDEWTGERLLDPATIREDLRLEGMEPVGNYAIRLAWNDGHSSGLFTWDLLREMADQLRGPQT
jgi:DUF971 family protein